MQPDAEVADQVVGRAGVGLPFVKRDARWVNIPDSSSIEVPIRPRRMKNGQPVPRHRSSSTPLSWTVFNINLDISVSG